MPVNNPSVWKMVIDGGILMGPFLLLCVAWLWISIEYLALGRRTERRRLALFWFPMAFIALAIANWVIHWHQEFGRMAFSWQTDPERYTSFCLITSRSTLVVCAVAGLALAVSLIVIMLPSRTRNAAANSLKISDVE